MLGSEKRGAPLVATKPPTQENVTPSDYGYSAMSPRFEKVQSFDDLSGGFGLGIQEGFSDKRYSYTILADCSIAGQILKGPDITTITPTGPIDSTNGVSHFFDDGTTLYALNGQYVQVRAGDTAASWTRAYDIGCEIQTVVLGGNPDGGTFTLSYGALTTAAMDHDVSAATMQTNLRALGSVLQSITVARTGVDPNYTYTITFTGTLGNATLLTSANSLTIGGIPGPTITHATTRTNTTGYDVSVFYTNAGGGAKYAYIAAGDGTLCNIWRFDFGSTWAQHASMQALAFCVRGREFYRAHSTNTVAKCDTDADPWTAANWGAVNAFTVGDKSSAIVRMAVAPGGELLVLKTDNVYTIDENGEDHQLYPHLKFAVSTENGKGYSAWLNSLYVPFSRGLHRIGADLSIQQMGPELIMTNDTEVQGYVTATFGDEPRCLYAGLYNPDTGASYLMKFGGYDKIGNRLYVWHGSISAQFASKKITALYKSDIGAASGHYRMYIGFSDGTVGWFTLPCTPNPTACSSYAFSTTNGELYLPKIHFGYQADYKIVRAVSMIGFNFSATNYLQFNYRSDFSASYTAMSGNFDNIPLSRLEFDTPLAGILWDIKLVLVSTATTSCPQLSGIGLHYQLRPENKLLYTFNILAADKLVKRDGTIMRHGADYVRDYIKTLADGPGVITGILPDESSQDLSIIGYTEGQAWNERMRQWQAAIAIEAAQVATNQVYGTYGRLEALGSYGTLENFTYGQLEGV